VSNVYLDNNATTFPLPEVKKALLEAAAEDLGNPSSAHEAGARSRARICRAREDVAALFGVAEDELVFTSGATEANSTVLRSLSGAEKVQRVVTTQVEHSSILRTCEFLETRRVEVVFLPVDDRGLIRLTNLAEAMDGHTVLVSIQWVNNETGVIQPVEAIGSICHERNVPFHTDAAQAGGKVPMELRDLPIDCASFAGHKLHAPQGVGVLWYRDMRHLRPLLHGGSQENSHRAGTENILGIIGFGAAARARHLRFSEIAESVKALRDEFEARVLADVPQTKVNGATDQRVWNCTNILFEGVDGTALVARLDQEGICCSQGSACTSMRPGPSYVLRAMGLSEKEAYASVRFSFSELNSRDDIGLTVEALKKLCSQIRTLMGKRNRVAV